MVELAVDQQCAREQVDLRDVNHLLKEVKGVVVAGLDPPGIALNICIHEGGPHHTKEVSSCWV